MIFLINSILALRAKPFPLLAKIAPLIGIKIIENQNYFEKVSMFNQNPAFFQSIVEIIFYQLPNIYESSNNLLLKYLILIIMEKIILFMDESQIKQVIEKSNLMNIIPRLINSEDIMIITITLLIVDQILQKYNKKQDSFQYQ